MGSRGTKLVLALAVFALLAGLTDATAHAARARIGPLVLTGQVKPRHVAWAREAATRMPLPRAKVDIVAGHFQGGGPAYAHSLRTLWIPAYLDHPGWERGYFLHELGHVADRHELDALERRAWLTAAGIPTCRWTAPCTIARYETTIDVEPEEMFAELYYACAAGTTRAAIEAAMQPTYGWLPDPAVEQVLCAASAQWLSS